MVEEYVRDYYIPLMKLQSTPPVNAFVDKIKEMENTGKVDDSFLETYMLLVNHIRNDIDDHSHVNMYFNRMRFDIIQRFKSCENFPTLHYITF